jgi:hypothetical protein
MTTVLYPLSPRQKIMALIIHAHAAVLNKKSRSYPDADFGDIDWFFEVKEFGYTMNFRLSSPHEIMTRDWKVYMDPSLQDMNFVANTDDFGYFTKSFWQLYRDVNAVFAKEPTPDWLVPRLKKIGGCHP